MLAIVILWILLRKYNIYYKPSILAGARIVLPLAEAWVKDCIVVKEPVALEVVGVDIFSS